MKLRLDCTQWMHLQPFSCLASRKVTGLTSEIGVAVERGVLVIPLIHGLNPYGFIPKYQGLSVADMNVSQVALEIFWILVTSPKTMTKMLSCLTETTIQSMTEEEALFKLSQFKAIRNLPTTHLIRLKESASTSSILMSGRSLVELNSLLSMYNIDSVTPMSNYQSIYEDVHF